MKIRALVFCLITASALFGANAVLADGAGDPAPATEKNGQYFDKEGNQTYKVDKDGTVDWYTYIGYQQFAANCMQCHGPDALGSSYAPNLVDALKSMTTSDVLGTIIGGKQNVSAAQDLVMPALGTNKNVMCYIDAIYTYLRARSDGAVGRGRPEKHADRPEGYDKTLDACFG